MSDELQAVFENASILGVRYNVVRRSSHKTAESALKKITEDGQAGRIGEWFGRWRVEISSADVAKFRRECLDPILEQLCIWYDIVVLNKPLQDEWWIGKGTDNLEYLKSLVHSREPFGIYDVVKEGGSSDLDEYLESGNEIGLQRVEKLFTELEP